ncbi:hypothetical protein BGZ73_001189, partial [Actinomortierella ambigua]
EIERSYDYDIEHIKGKTNPADFLSRNIAKTTIDDNETELDDICGLMEGVGGMDYAIYLALTQCLTDLTYLLDAQESDRRKLRNRSRGYKLLDGKLFRKTKQGLKEVLHERSAEEAIRKIHDESHDGIDNTLHRTKRRYAGPNLMEVVRLGARINEHGQIPPLNLAAI